VSWLRTTGTSYEAQQKAIREIIDGETTPLSERLEQLEPTGTVGGVDIEKLAEVRGMSMAGLRGLLRKELEWIPLMAMRKDVGRRYATVAELADDVQRYLDGQPLRAGPESGWYRARKFVGRNRVQVAAGVVVVSLVVATGVSARFGVREADQRVVAEK